MEENNVFQVTMNETHTPLNTLTNDEMYSVPATGFSLCFLDKLGGFFDIDGERLNGAGTRQQRDTEVKRYVPSVNYSVC